MTNGPTGKGSGFWPSLAKKTMSVPTPPSGTGSESDPSHARKLAEDVPRSAAPAKPSSAQFDAFAGAHVRHRRRRRKKEPPYLAIAAGVSILILAAVMVGTGLVYLLNHRTTQAARGGDLLGRYIDDASTVDREYQHYYGKAPETPIPSQEFQRAAEMVRKRGFAQAADVLESVAKQAALPVVYNDLGVLYAQLNDWARAGTDFREALALDQHYAAVLDNIHRMKGLSPDVGGAFTREVEPNNNRFAANLIAVGIPVEGEITAGAGDIDFFRFSFPPSPRDVLAVELSNHDFKFSPRLDIYDGEMRVLDWGRKTVAYAQRKTTKKKKKKKKIANCCSAKSRSLAGRRGACLLETRGSEGGPFRCVPKHVDIGAAATLGVSQAPVRSTSVAPAAQRISGRYAAWSTCRPHKASPSSPGSLCEGEPRRPERGAQATRPAECVSALHRVFYDVDHVAEVDDVSFVSRSVWRMNGSQDQLQARERDPAGPDPAAPVRVRALLRRITRANRCGPGPAAAANAAMWLYVLRRDLLKMP